MTGGRLFWLSVSVSGGPTRQKVNMDKIPSSTWDGVVGRWHPWEATMIYRARDAGRIEVPFRPAVGGSDIIFHTKWCRQVAG